MASMVPILLCDTVPELLRKPVTVRVHSVFHHACNLQLATGKLLTLQARGTHLAPGGCLLDHEDFRGTLEKGEPIMLSPGAIHGIRSTVIALDQAPRQNLKISKRPSSIFFAQKLSKFVRKSPPENCFFNSINRINCYCQNQKPPKIITATTAIGHWLRSNDSNDFDPSLYLSQMIGFGCGLTPSADDFLVGLLITLDALQSKKRIVLTSSIRPLLKRTTDISAAMLAHACDGRYGSAILKLFESSPESIDGTIIEAAKHGHSSGHDMLYGIQFALTHLLINENNHNQHTSSTRGCLHV